MTKTFSKSLGSITYWIIGVLTILVPLFILPFTPESYELNKQYLLILGVLLAFFAWLGKSLVDKEFQYRRTPLDTPLVVFWIVAIASLVFAADRRLALFGNYDSLAYGFIPLTVYLAFTFLITNTVSTIKQARHLSLLVGIAGMVVSLIFLSRVIFPDILGAMGFVAYSPIAALTSQFGVFAVAIFLLAIGMVATKKNGSIGADIFWGILAALAFASLLALGFKLIWFIATIGIFIFLVQGVSRLHEFRFAWISVGFVALVISLLLTFFGTPKFISAQLPLEITLSYGTSWGIARDAITDGVKSFLVGSGESHFGRDFSKFRPETFNGNFAWNIRFNDSTNTVFNVIDNHGVLGGLALLGIILIGVGTIVYLWMRKTLRAKKVAEALPGTAESAEPQSFGYFWTLSSVWIALVVALFVVHFGTTLWFLFWTVTALLMATARDFLRASDVRRVSLRSSPQYALLTAFAFTLVFAAFVVLGIYLGRFYTAEVAYAKALRSISSGQNDGAIRHLGRAVSLRPSRAQFHLILARTYLAQAIAEAQKNTPQPNLITTLLAGAVNEARTATNLEPTNVTTWEALASMYANARVVAPDANDWVIRSLDKAIGLEKTNPAFYLQLGNAQLAAKQIASAKKNFERSIQLKPNFVDAYVALSLLEEQEKDTDVAISHMAQAVLFSNQRNPIVLFQLGRMLYNRNKTGDLSQAEAAVRAAVQINGDYSDALYTLGLIVERAGKTQEAIELYRKVQKLNPDNAEVRKKINALTAPPPEE